MSFGRGRPSPPSLPPKRREGTPQASSGIYSRRLENRAERADSAADRRGQPGGSLRRGISLTETMVAMMVALIGVFGVFVLIPFAVRQVEIGMNLEAAQTLARNGMSDFDAQGFQNTDRWALPDTTTMGAPFFVQPINPPAAPVLPATRSRQVFCIDPWGWTLNGLVPGVDPGDPGGSVRQIFIDCPYTNDPAPTWPVFPRLSLFERSTPTDVFTRGLARRMFSGHDDLILSHNRWDVGPDTAWGVTAIDDDGNGAVDDISEAGWPGSDDTRVPIGDISGPNQEFFPGMSGRQYDGRLTWQMFAVQDYSAEGYARFYAAVSLGRTPDTKDRVFSISSPGPYSRGGDFVLNELTTPPTSPAIRRGQWMMLIDGTPAPANKVNDIAFYRVLESDLDAGTHTVTLQGSDLTPEAGSSVFAVLLPDVIAVYERTMKYETSSNWNLN